LVTIQKVEISNRNGETKWIFLLLARTCEKVHTGSIDDIRLLGSRRPHVQTSQRLDFDEEIVELIPFKCRTVKVTILMIKL